MIPALIPFEVFGVGINVVGLVVAMVFSAAIAVYYRQRYFQYWTLSYVFMTASITLLPISDHIGRPLWLALLVSVLYYTHVHLIAESAYALNNRPIPRGWRIFSSVFGVALVAMQVAGVSFLIASGLMAIVNVYVHVVMGLALARFPGAGPRGPRVVTGNLVIATGLWTLTYPVIEPAGLAWLGYTVAGLLHLFVGMGMVVFLLEQAAAQLRVQNDELKQVDRLKTNFIATVSHELRTPLTVIKGSTSILQDELVGPLNAMQKQQLHHVESNTEALILQINDLLDFSRLDAGMMEFRKEPGLLNETVQQAAERFSSLFTARHQDFLVEVHDAPLDATVDHARVQQVVGNLLSNAAKFSPAGSRVTLSLRRQGDVARLEVRDTGPGLPPDQLERIFLRFYQVDGSDTRKVGGSGLGLAICRSIVEEGHGGRIWAENVPPQGSMFVATLPLAPNRQVAPASAEIPTLLFTPGTHP